MTHTANAYYVDEALPVPITVEEPLTIAEAEEFDRIANAALKNHPPEPFASVAMLQNAQAAQQRMFAAPPVTGYRDLTEVELAMVNRVKKMGTQIEALVFEIDAHINAQKDRARIALDGTAALAEGSRLRRAQPDKWLVLAVQDLQAGLMKLTRAVAQPSTFA